MVGGGDDWDQIEAEGEAARAAASTRGAAPAPHSAAPTSSYGGVTIGGIGDDDPFADDVPAGALELDLPVQHQRSKPPAPEPPAPGRAPTSLEPPRGEPSRPPESIPSMAPVSSPRSIQPSYPAAAAADPAALIARFPAPPDGIFAAPGYAFRVLWRQMELRQDLASLKKRRSPDVPLFERALRTYDARTFALGLLLGGAIFAVVTFLVFLPVIIRFASN